MKHKLRLWSCLTLALAMGLPIAGCTFKGDIARQKALAREDGDQWRPHVVDMRVYPSSKFARVDQQLIVEARVELLDQMGDSIKSSGVAQFQLNTTGYVSGSSESRSLYKWDITLDSLEDQRTYYDPITRAYLFRLKLDQHAAPQVPTSLQVVFTLPNGQRLSAQATLPVIR